MKDHKVKSVRFWLSCIFLLGGLSSCASNTTSPPQKNLDALYAVNAFHEALLEMAKRHGIDVHYQGDLARTNQNGLQPPGFPTRWEIGTLEGRDIQGLVSRLATQLFTVELVTSEDASGSIFFEYRGLRYSVRILNDHGHENEEWKAVGMTPLEFVSSACKMVSRGK